MKCRVHAIIWNLPISLVDIVYGAIDIKGLLESKTAIFTFVLLIIFLCFLCFFFVLFY